MSTDSWIIEWFSAFGACIGMVLFVCYMIHHAYSIPTLTDYALAFLTGAVVGGGGTFLAIILIGGILLNIFPPKK